MYVKYINQHSVENAPRVIRTETHVYSNPTPEILLRFGYKLLVETECPQEEGYYYTALYEETETTVIRNWEAHEMPEPEPEPEPENQESVEPVQENTEDVE